MERSNQTKPDRLTTTLVCMGCLLLVISVVWLLGTAALAAPPNVPPTSIASSTEGHVPRLMVGIQGAQHSLSLLDTIPFYTTERPITDARLIKVPGSDVMLALWEERSGSGERLAFYAISHDGQRFARARQTSYALKLRHGQFDPARGIPGVPAALAAGAENRMFIVQFWTQPLEVFRRQIAALGVRVYGYLPQHAQLVEMDAAAKRQVEMLPYVRWVGPYHPVYRLEPSLTSRMGRASRRPGQQRYNIMVHERGMRQKTIVADRIGAMGGTVDALQADGYRLKATLTSPQLLDVVRMDEVLYVDRWRPSQPAMDIVRDIGGANFVETVAGYTGAGVRAEILDQNLDETHADFAALPTIFHGPRTGPTSHGTATYGICFGDGTGFAGARGLLPDAQGIFADFTELTDRYQHTADLLANPYFAVLQSNSWGTVTGSPTSYSTVSAELDDILFIHDILVLHSMGNGGSTGTPFEQAWAKNVVSVGGIFHQNTLATDDDCWCEGGVNGPAPDGRIKPDLVHFYDQVLTTAPNGGYVIFGGTSASTAITAGHFGLFFQMWSGGIFGSTVDPQASVFDNRPHAATAKAILINTASAYAFSGAAHDLTRMHQGWGIVDLQSLYDQRDRMLIVDETDLLANLGMTQYPVEVPAGEVALRATLVYSDPMGVVSSSVNRVNDVTLKVVSPSGTVYWGNNGLLEGNWSTPGGTPNTIDTVENVFVQNPESGTWLVEVHADEINTDGHPETPQLDADYALVVSGVMTNPVPCPLSGDIDCDDDVDAVDQALFIQILLGIDTGDPQHILRSDLDGSGTADGIDIRFFVSAVLNR